MERVLEAVAARDDIPVRPAVSLDVSLVGNAKSLIALGMKHREGAQVQVLGSCEPVPHLLDVLRVAFERGERVEENRAEDPSECEDRWREERQHTDVLDVVERYKVIQCCRGGGRVRGGEVMN